MSVMDNVYGRSYTEAESILDTLDESLYTQAGKGFPDVPTLEQWAHSHLLDKVVYSNMSHQFLCLSHRGELMTATAFEDYYQDILYTLTVTDKGKVKKVLWHPSGYKYYSKAYVVSEKSDGIHRPLYYRDYFLPTGYYNNDTDTFNVAKPFPVFAKETGRDTSHIYEYISHIAGECAPWLLAWLRAKLLQPTVKTQVVPIFVSREQGSGKTTFAEVICKGLFGEQNVIVSDQYDATARFNADYADALIVCQEEKEEIDKKNPAGTLKSRATATTIRKEQKGIDPIYQDSFTDFILTTNKDVPIKFDGSEDQRRFMVMEADKNFTRKQSTLADEVFSKLYGFDGKGNKTGVPFVKDKELISQFEHELVTRDDIAKVPLRDFPKTSAYKRCYTLPRTNESTEIESIMRGIAPFIRQSLLEKRIVDTVETPDGRVLKLTDYVPYAGALQYFPKYKDIEAYVAVCRPIVFSEMGTQKPFAHSVIERGLYDCDNWLFREFGINLIPDMSPIVGGFANVAGRYSTAAAARFKLASTPLEEKRAALKETDEIEYTAPIEDYKEQEAPEELGPLRMGQRLRVNNFFAPDANGCYETVNEMKPGIMTLKNKSQNVAYMDTFLLESDTPVGTQQLMEEGIAAQHLKIHGANVPIQASKLYKARLDFALKESQKLFDEGKVARIVYSGGKSYHLLVRVKDMPTTLEEYKWLHAYLVKQFSDKLEFDTSTSDPARLTRSPLRLARESTAYGVKVVGTQYLVAEDWSHVLNLKWRGLYEDYQRQPHKTYEASSDKPLYPTKPEYTDAVNALLDGTFWTDSKFNGQRQKLFFPAYRLLRVTGHSESECWQDIILPGLTNYIKPNEIGYWKSRRDCDLIQKINNEVEHASDIVS